MPEHNHLIDQRRVSARQALAGAALLLACAGAAMGQNPFAVTAAWDDAAAGERRLRVSFTVPDQYDLYADSIAIAAPEGMTLTPLQTPAVVQKYDAFSGATHGVFTSSVSFVYRVTGASANTLEINVAYQGCSRTACFLPTSTRLIVSGPAVSPSGATARTIGPPVSLPEDRGPVPADWTNRMQGFTIAGRQTGYLGPAQFLRFLDESESGTGVAENLLQDMLSKSWLWAWVAIILIILGGFGLNLTPCVLPMIPVNLSILGAGTGSGSRARGLMLGSVYGSAMALAYGLLGVSVVLTGAKFGMLNSSPVFNAIVAVIFLILSLAMFDVFFLDFSRWQGSGPLLPRPAHRFLTAFVMGTVAALLAGSCVSPILVSVLLLAADLYQRGEVLGLLLPFLLGLGMGLPWPLLGAGLSFLPPPGKWMLNVKRLFGIIILGFAVYYGVLAYRLYRERDPQSRAQVENAQQESLNQGWGASLPDALEDARRRRQPVLIDIWASWCKNCLAMDETTFRNPRVTRRLDAYIKVKFRADNLTDPDIRTLMDYFGSIGLPTYIVLHPAAEPDATRRPAVKEPAPD